MKKDCLSEEIFEVFSNEESSTSSRPSPIEEKENEELAM